MKNLALLLLGIALIGSMITDAVSRQNFPTRIPNGTTYSCGTCHQGGVGGAPRNPFGKDVEARLSGGMPNWNADLANLDSDGDGVSNGIELGDPEGTWRPGNPNPSVEVYHPGDQFSTPPLADVEDFYSGNGISIVSTAPNPFASNVIFKLNSIDAGLLVVSISDINGNKSIIFSDNIGAGEFSLQWDGTSQNGQVLTNGVYFVTFQLNGNIVGTNVVLSR